MTVDTPYSVLAKAYDILMYDVDYAAWAAYLCGLLEEYGAKKGAKVLDAACGTGNISLFLYNAGYEVTALDISGEMLNAAVGKFREAGAAIPVIQQDLREIALHKKMDAIVCACDGVNYLLSDEDAAAFFTSAYGSLRDNGILLFDVSTEYKLKEVVADNVFCDETEDIAYIWKNSFEEDFSHMALTLFMRDGDVFRRYTEDHVQKAHRLDTMERLLREAGFTEVKIYGFRTKDTVQEDTERVQICARK